MTAWLFLLLAVLPRTVRLLFHGRLLTRALPPSAPRLGGRGPTVVRPAGACPRTKAHTAPLCHKAGPRAPSPSHRHCLALWRSPIIRETTSIRLVEGG